MRTRSTTLVAGLLTLSLAAATPSAAQTTTARADSTHRFSLFGGRAGTETRGPENGLVLGASGDFRWTPIPVPLRLSLSFSERHDDFQFAPSRGGSASLEAVMRPIPRRFGLQPYFLGGLGMATRAGYNGWTTTYQQYANDPFMLPSQPIFVSHGRQSWAFASAGAGLDIGRAFIQLRFENPVASQGPVVVPLSIGFRFWD